MQHEDAYNIDYNYDILKLLYFSKFIIQEKE